jgi:hypothetical protein
MAPEVECLSSKCLSLNPKPTKTKQQKTQITNQQKNEVVQFE